MKRIALFTLASAVAACTSSSMSTTSGPATTQDYDDTAQAVASMTVSPSIAGGAGGAASMGGDVFMLPAAMGLARGDMPFGFAARTDGHVHGDMLGVAHDFTVACTDAAGAAQAKCGKTTDSAKIDVSLSGSVKTPNVDFSVMRMATFTITGLQSDTATLNGNSTFSLDSTVTSVFHQDVTASLSIDASSKLDAITLSTKNREITGGTATFDLTVHRTVTGNKDATKDVDKTFTASAALTFNADHTASLVIDGTQKFTIDLTTGKITKAA